MLEIIIIKKKWKKNKRQKKNYNKLKGNNNKDNKKEKNKKNYNKSKGNNKKYNKNEKNKINKDKSNKYSQKKKNLKKNKENQPPKKSKKDKFNINKTNKTYHTDSTSNFKPKKKIEKMSINAIQINNINNCDKRKKGNNNKISSNIIIYKNKMKSQRLNKSIIWNNSLNYKNLNDQELNTLEYNLAIKIDKRTYFQYYWSLLKKKHLIFFTFLPNNYYNLFSLKLALFLMSFSLYFTINGFFFSDKTMHKIHKDNGAYDIIYQIPQVLYSSLISSVINMILKLLSLSEKNILIIKKEKDIKIALKKSKNIESCISIKFIIFFLLSNILLLFFWYFISCFCAVYTNTQIILIKDTFLSFGLSMIYPFGLNLFPGMLRIPALTAKNKDKKILYQISVIVALI